MRSPGALAVFHESAVEHESQLDAHTVIVTAIAASPPNGRIHHSDSRIFMIRRAVSTAGKAALLIRSYVCIS
jgi:hypothetical protein